jgi:ribose transport system permease protein
LRLPGLHQASALYLLAAIFLLFGLWIPNTFLTATTFKVVGGDQVVVAVLALALLIPLTAGVFDLSVGNMLAFSLVIVSWFQANTGLNGFVSSVLAVLACGAVGFVSGLVVVRFRVDSFIATLGMSQILAAGTLYISSNKQIVGVLSPTFLEFGRKEILGIPVVVYYLVALALVIWYVLAFTPLGATSSPPAPTQAARLSGVRTDRLVWGSLVGRASSPASPASSTAPRSDRSRTASVRHCCSRLRRGLLRSTQFKSRPNVWGTLLAVYTLAFGVKGLQLALRAASTGSRHCSTRRARPRRCPRRSLGRHSSAATLAHPAVRRAPLTRSFPRSIQWCGPRTAAR